MIQFITFDVRTLPKLVLSTLRHCLISLNYSINYRTPYEIVFVIETLQTPEHYFCQANPFQVGSCYLMMEKWAVVLKLVWVFLKAESFSAFT